MKHVINRLTLNLNFYNIQCNMMNITFFLFYEYYIYNRNETTNIQILSQNLHSQSKESKISS